ncbi:serine/threonine-protein kinase [Nocardia inohanensis]|uniref:serine/threonine-protein kinase n=1 Tax=Nocardia inohanensis TaxID=209246 RepID=UPI0008301328|nr:serine/threonine-protein kinase [Nocardia inohanensis]
MTVKHLAPGDPRQIGRYRILGVLGAGGMGRVLLGTGADGRLVAIKQVHGHLLDENEYRARFRREVTATTRVSGAFTAPVIDFDIDAPSPWLASAFVLGVPLDQVVSEWGPLPVPSLRMLAAGLAAALEAIHRAGLVHRDLKPANVLLAADGPRVIDFGIAQLAENPGGLTETGSTLGSPAFMSPEQALSERVTAASDVFSLGVLMMNAATGTSPFAAPTMAYTLFNIVHIEPELSGVPPELRELVATCLHKDPAARPTPAQILHHLGQPELFGRPWPEPVHAEIDRRASKLTVLTADPEGTSVLPGARRRPNPTHADVAGARPSGPRRRRSRILVAALAAVLVVAGTAGAAWWRRSENAQAGSTQLTLAELRQTDACGWLRMALGAALPDKLVPTWSLDVSEWKFETAADWGCHVVGGNNQSLTFEPGGYFDRLSPTGTTLAGRPVLGAAYGDYSCERGLQTAGTQEHWGLKVIVGKSDQCALADYALTELIAVTAPARTGDDRSLARVDPCTLVDRDTLTTLLGPQPDDPAQVSAHGCGWTGSADVNVTAEWAAQVADRDPVIDLGDGHTLVAPTSTVAAICTRYYRYREAGGGTEQVQIKVQGGPNAELNCRTAESVARVVVAKLPK